MNTRVRHQKQPSTRSLVRLLCFLFVALMLNACLGCKRVLNIKVENNGTSAVTIVSVRRISLNDVEQDSIHNLGAIAPGGTIELSNAIPDEDEEFVLQIQDIYGNTIGEVRQSREVVQSKMEGRTWCVKIPADMTPLHTAEQTKTPSR